MPAVWVAAVCLLTVATVVAPAAGLALAAGRVRRLVAAVYEEETELAGAIRHRPGTWRDAVAAAATLAVVAEASTVMEVAATGVERRYVIAEIATGGLVLAVVTSLPNAVGAVYLARRGAVPRR